VRSDVCIRAFGRALWGAESPGPCAAPSACKGSTAWSGFAPELPVSNRFVDRPQRAGSMANSSATCACTLCSPGSIGVGAGAGAPASIITASARRI
jgi:hypothetical protein